MTEETKRRIAEGNRGKIVSNETKIKMSESHKGKKWSELHRKHINESCNGTGGFSGKHHSEETKERIRLNSTKHWLNHKKSDETRKKMSEAHLKEKCYNWQGGKSFEPYSVDWTRTLRISIRERDKYTCQLCEEKQGDIAFCVHHIDYDKKNCCPDNLITLCRKCHFKTNHNREYWIEYFNN